MKGVSNWRSKSILHILFSC